MSRLPIKIYGDPLLREVSSELKDVSDLSRQLVKNMAETMYSYEGVGLAAPQIGIMKRLIVLDIGDRDFVAYINPEITFYSDKEEVDDEGCLCLPEIRVPVKRALRVGFKALDLKGRPVQFEATEFLARVLQHEIDHLQGKTILEKTSTDEKNKAIKKMMEFYDDLRSGG